MGGSPPTGTCAFLFTDIVGSTRAWEARPDTMGAAVERHDEIVRSAVAACDGYVFSTQGDAFAVSFSTVDGARSSALEVQRRIGLEPWPEGTAIRVRIGLHVGSAEERSGDYFGPTLNRVARIRDAAHGGQILSSNAFSAALEGRGLTDLGVHRLKDLSTPERLWQLGSGQFPPPRTLDRSRHNLPAQRTSLVGRTEELAHIAALVGDHRLVTLTGVGGSGKTRLALAVAAEVLDRFPDGVFFVDLSPVTDGALVPSMVAGAVGLTLPVDADREPADLVAAELGDRTLLLVIDNCEQVVDSAAETVDALLDAGPGVRVLATSRETLLVEGEHAVRVPCLDWDGDDGADVGPAVELLVERAADAGAELDVGTDLPHLREICARVDGMPLAIELAAVQLRHLPPAQLLANLDERFRVLVGGRRRRQRQQTLAAMMDWSWDLLDDAQRHVLSAVSVFAGGFTARAVRSVAGLASLDASRLLGELVAKSLLVPARDRVGVRYRLLETVRLYGLQKLAERGDLETTRNAHAAWLADWCDDATFEEQWLSADHAARMRGEFDNVRSALDWLAGTGDERTRARIIRSCCYLFREDFHRDEALAWTSDGRWSSLPPADRARMELVTAEARYVHLDYEGMRAAGRRAHEIAAASGHDAIAAAGLAISCQGLVNVRPDVGLPRLREAVVRAERAGSTRVEAIAWALLLQAEDHAELTIEEQRMIVARIGELAGPSGLDHEVAVAAAAKLRIATGDARGAHDLFQSLIDESIERGLTTSASRIAISAACCAAEIPDRSLFHDDVQLAVDEFHRAGVHRAAADLVMVLGYWESRNGDPTVAAELLAVARTQLLFDMDSYALWRVARDAVRDRGDTTGIDEARQRGAALDVAETLARELARHQLTSRPFRSDTR